MIDINVWEEQISIAEKLLIYYCSPPYNTQHINSYGHIETHTILLNLGKKNRLPIEVSTFWEENEFWSGNWKPYKLEN